MASIVPIPAVNAAIFNEKGQILLTRRSSKVRAPGHWVLPGGHVDPGEDWAAACRREVREEVGLDVNEQRLLGLYSDPALTVTEETLAGGYRGQFVVVVYLVTSYSGEVRPNDEVDLWGWYDSHQLPGPLLKSHPIRIEDAFRRGSEVYVR